jgi:hypothetical protein
MSIHHHNADACSLGGFGFLYSLLFNRFLTLADWIEEEKVGKSLQKISRRWWISSSRFCKNITRKSED